MPKFHRRSLRLQGFDYSQSGAYFVTVCVDQRRSLLGTITDGEMRLSEFGLIVVESWKWLPSAYPYVSLDEWIVMSNHFHGIIILDRPVEGGSRTAPTMPKPLPLSRIMGAFKTVSSKQINLIRRTPGASFWQRGFYEHVIRDEKSLNRIREYIDTNPLRRQLDWENLQATGQDDFDNWLAKFHPRPNNIRAL